MTGITVAAPRRAFVSWQLVKGIFGAILGIAFGLALGAAAVAIIATQLFGFRIVSVSSNSMAPELTVGEFVVIRPASQSDVEEGDVIFFRQGVDQIPTIHRVVGENKINTVLRDPATGEETTYTERHFLTKGDANERPDTGEVAPSALEGELWFTVPFLKQSGGLSLQTVLIGIAGVLAIGWVSYEGYSRLGKKAGRRDAEGA